MVGFQEKICIAGTSVTLGKTTAGVEIYWYCWPTYCWCAISRTHQVHETNLGKQTLSKQGVKYLINYFIN
jgi:hypothetical protein